jgi:phosphoribosylpyrophosphate synthetase
VALAVKDEQLARDLYQYKDPRQSERERHRLRLGLAAVLWRWLSHHEACLSRSVGIEEFSIVSTVPSTRGRLSHPLDIIVGRDVALTRGRFQRLLEPVGVQQRVDDRIADASQFKAVGAVPEGTSVLLIDDTFTTGSRVQSAAARLRLSGAGTVGVICLGRHFNRRQDGAHAEAAEAYLQQVRARGWSWSSCCLCG